MKVFFTNNIYLDLHNRFKNNLKNFKKTKTFFRRYTNNIVLRKFNGLKLSKHIFLI